MQTLFSLMVSIQPPCAVSSISVRTLKTPSTVSYIPLFGHTKILHTLVGMGSAALAATVPYPGYGDPNFPRGTRKY